MNTEQQLRDALRPEEPDTGFAARVQARIDAQSTSPRASRRATGATRRWLLPTALAATLLLAVGISQQVSERREQAREQQRELYAHEQLMHALAITSARLDDVHRHLERNSLE
ncbi:MAG: hypothetical protein ABI859_08790 [Pseudomonadota bacterium]